MYEAAKRGNMNATVVIAQEARKGLSGALAGVLLSRYLSQLVITS
jgi:glycine/D-amino acid oxidase-like deaminating enzyme